MRRKGDDVVFLPVVQEPGFPIDAEHRVCRARAKGVISTGGAAHDEDFLGAPELVDGLRNEEIVDRVGDGVFVNASKVNEKSALEIAPDVTHVVVVVAVHQGVVSGNEVLHRVYDDSTEQSTQVGGFLKGVVLVKTDGSGRGHDRTAHDSVDCAGCSSPPRAEDARSSGGDTHCCSDTPQHLPQGARRFVVFVSVEGGSP